MENCVNSNVFPGMLRNTAATAITIRPTIPTIVKRKAGLWFAISGSAMAVRRMFTAALNAGTKNIIVAAAPR